MKKTIFSLALSLFLTTPIYTIASELPPPDALAPDSGVVEEAQDDIKAFEDMFPADQPDESDFWRQDRLLITATGSQVPVRLAPSVATVISTEDIEKIGATSLDDILATVPGLHVLPSGIAGFSSTWSIRGLTSTSNPHVLLLIDGVPFTLPSNGGRPQTYKMPVSMISRVEVLRGPGSAVHGADAFSGVVNVITKDNFEIDGTRTGVRVGSFNSTDVWLQHGGQYKGWDLWGSVEWMTSDGDHDRIVEKDYLHNLGLPQFSNAPGYLDTQYEFVSSHFGLRKEKFTMRAYGSWRIDNALGPGGLQAITYENDFDGHELLFDLEYRDKNFAKNWDVSIRFHSAYMETDNTYQMLPPGFRNMIGEPIGEMKYSGVEASSFYEGFKHHRLRLSTGYKAIDANTDQYKNFGPAVDVQFGPLVNIRNTPYIYMEDQNRHLWFATIQDKWDFARGWTLTAGVRYDEYSDFGSTVNPRAALVWEPLHYLTTKLLYGRAFRAPSFNEQYLQNNPVATGNPDLDPETIDTYELSFDFQPTASLHAVLSAFTYQAEDLIEYVGAAPAPSTNYGEQKGTGFELDMQWQCTDTFQLRGNFSYQRSKNEMTDKVVADTPEIQFYLNPQWKFADNWSLDGQYFLIADRHRAEGDIRDDIDDYDQVNFSLRRKNIAERWDVAFGVRNLFNEDIREPSPYSPAAKEGAMIPNDYPMEGRAVWGEVRCKF